MLVLATLILSVSQFVFAEKMDLETHNVLIQKIEKGFDKKSAIADTVQLRLADLYADRARLKTMKEMDQGCTNCLKSKEDRQAALSKYLRLFEIYTGAEQERILVQIVQMNRLMDSSFAKKKFYTKIITKKRYGKALKARATQALAEIHFYDGDFKTAQQQYKKAIQMKPSLRTYLTRYRLAWCSLNLGSVQSAQNQLVGILKNKNDLSKDPTMHADMALSLIHI